MNHQTQFDVAIIGAGPGGYVAAIKLAQNGKKVALIEKQYVGGTCLNVGCIPTKTLVHGATLLHKIKQSSELGIEIGSIKIAYEKMKQRKDSVVKKIKTSLEGLLKTNSITIFNGHGQFQSSNEIKITGQDNQIISFKTAIIATGSEPFDVPAFPCDHKLILNSTSILELEKLPKTLTIIGGGYIGCEFASLFNELGSKVTIIEAMDSILAGQGDTVSNYLTEEFKAKGITIKTKVKVLSIDTLDSSVKISLSDGSTLESEKALIAIGRKPVTKNLHLEKVALQTDEKGFIPVDDTMQTVCKNIFAIGDVTGKAMLAHVASHQAIVAASNILENKTKMHYDVIPSVIFSYPEIAQAGLSEAQAIEKGYTVTKATVPYQALGKAQIQTDPRGFAQIIADKKTGQILGATIIGEDASNLIAEITLAIQNEIPLECVADTIHAHPTLAEIWHETALLTMGTPLHIPPKKK